MPRRKQISQKQGKINRSSQTSPKCQEDNLENFSESRLLLDSSPSLLNRRASSVPDLSSSETEKFSRPISASDRFCGTPSPSQVSCYGGPGHTCHLCSTSWSLTSSDYTLTQTVSDRTTSTQDSTLSVQSTSPSVPTPVPLTSEQLHILENSIFQPQGNFIAVHTESILLRPISIIDSSENWHYGFSPDDVESQLAMAPQSVGTITEDDIEAITSGRKDRSTSIGEWPKTDTEMMSSKGIQASEDASPKPQDMASQTTCNGNDYHALADIPQEVSIVKYSDHSPLSKQDGFHQRRIASEFIDSEKGRSDNKLLRHQKTQFTSVLKNSKSFPPSCYNAKPRKVDAEVAVTGGNYKDVEDDSVIARYSAVPRSNSMLVNTSSVDYTSDSDLSLTDSLEDGNDDKNDWPENRHDNRLVRGEVTLDDTKNRKRYPKGQDAYAYFLSLTGEQDMIKECPVPDWLRARLKRREEEIKKLFEVKLNKHHQTIIYRRRKKLVRHMDQYHGGSSNKPKPTKAIRWEDQRNERPPTIVNMVQHQPEQSMQLSPKKDQRKEESDPEQPVDRANSQQSLQTIPDVNKYVHISEVIKIEMSNQLKTVITKEKQINLNHDAFLRDGKSIQTSEIINNEDAHNSQRIIMRTNVGNFEIAQNNTMIDLQHPALVVKEPEKEEAKTADESSEVETGTQTIPEHSCGKSLLAKPEGSSWKQLVPLFHSKADDQTVADVLLSAMKEDKLTPPGKVSVVSQTSDTSSEEEGVQTVESSCNTDQPYLSESIQTSESFLESQTVESLTVETPLEVPMITMDKSEQCDEASIDYVPTEILQTEHKECNTEAFSVSEMVQTRESFKDDDKSFVEAEKDEITVMSQLSQHKGTDVFEEVDSFTSDKSCNTANPLITSSVQTDILNAVNEVKPLVVEQKTGKKKDVQFDESKIQQTAKSKKIGGDKFSRQKRDTPTPYCTRSNPELNSTDILELNVPPCTCHMCTFHKRAHTTGGSADKTKDGRKTAGTKNVDLLKDKKPPKFPNNRRNVGKFKGKFEVIPEEKGGSTESIPDEQRNENSAKNVAPKTLVTTGTMTKDPGKHVSIQEPPLDEKVDENTQTVIQEEEVVHKKVLQVNAKKSNLVIGESAI